MTEPLVWRRYVLDRDDEEQHVELARLGSTLFVRTGRGERAPRVETHALASDAVAERSLERRVAALHARGYLADGVVTRPAPDVATRADRAAERERLAAEARAAFEGGLVAFVRAWRALGHDPCLSFREQCKGTRKHPRDLAQQCLDLVASTCGVGFTRRTATYDDEHGALRSIPPHLLADFYAGPPTTLAIAYCKLRGRCLRSDDADAPGLEDELVARMRALPTD